MSKGQSAKGFKLMLQVFALFVFPLLIYLGFWQLDRAEEKRGLIDSYKLASNAEALVAAKVDGTIREEWLYRKLTVTGYFDPQRYFLLDNRIRKGRAGYEVIGVLKPEDGKHWLLVNFGWVAADATRLSLPEIRMPVARQYVTGIAHSPEPGFTLVADQWSGHWPYVIQSLEVKHLSTVLQHSLSPWVMRLESTLIKDLDNKWPVTAMSPEKHVAYAVQWFSMALMLFLLLLWSWRYMHRESVGDE